MEKENLFAVLFFGLLGGLIMIFISNLSETDVIVTTEKTQTVIDSTWYTTPGQENTMQTDFRYYGRTKNGQVVVSTSKHFDIGDTIECIYHRYENTKKEKK